MSKTTDSIVGAGLGFRYPHAQEILRTQPDVAWFEVITENLWTDSPLHHDLVARLRDVYPVVFHGVGMNLGGASGVCSDYLKRLKVLKDRYEPQWVSDHLCWTAADGSVSHDLLPLPFTDAALSTITANIQRVQDELQEQILVENITYYHQFEHADYNEWEFIKEVCQSAGCALLLDVNNLYINSQNFGFDPHEFLAGISTLDIKQVHLAGHQMSSPMIIDSHSQPTAPVVWQLYKDSLAVFGGVPTNCEWDQDLPDFGVLASEHSLIRDALQGFDDEH